MSEYLLVVDTSGPRAYAGLGSLTDSQRFFAWHCDIPNSHNERLAEGIASLQQQATIDFSHVKYLAVGEGPGSFTGLRIGFGLLKGMSAARRVPLLAVCSFAARAQACLTSMQQIAAVFSDARREESFLGLFALDASGLAQVVQQVGIYPNHEVGVLSREIASAKGKDLIFVADPETNLVPDLTAERPLQMARALFALAKPKCTKNLLFNTNILSSLAPRYLREVAAKSLADRGLGTS